MKPKISVIITDLDNTLFDWFEIWYTSFNAMLTSLVDKSGIPREILEDEFMGIHQKHGTAEYAFSLEELPSLIKKHPDGNIPEIYSECIQAYREARRSVMRLFPNVLETLCALKSQGCLIVGYTESMAFYSLYRVKKFKLDGILDYLYSPADHDIPDSINLDQVRLYETDYYKLHHTIHSHTPKGELKPNPKLLNEIIQEVGADPEKTIYIGDSLMKDVTMAKKASIKDVWAKYGDSTDDPRYELLRKVTHWTKEDVEREKKLKPADTPPSYILENAFSNVFAFFEFEKYTKPSDDLDIDNTIKVWEKTVDVQQHFNDLCLRIRNYAIAVLTAILGVSALALKEGYRVNFLGTSILLSAIFTASALLPWAAFWFMDRCWYHKFLLGAVENGEKIENSLGDILPGIRLATHIRKHSPIKIPKVNIKISSNNKFYFFYGAVALFIVFITIPQFFIKEKVKSPENKTEKATVVSVENVDIQIPKDFAEIHLHLNTSTEKAVPEVPEGAKEVTEDPNSTGG